MATSGTLKLRVIEAKMTRDTDFFSKMDPYVVIETRHQKLKTRVKQGAGKLPRWDEVFDLDVKYIGDDMTVTVYDEYLTSSDLVSLTKIISKCYYRWAQLLLKSLLFALMEVLMTGGPSTTKANNAARFTLGENGDLM